MNHMTHRTTIRLVLAAAYCLATGALLSADIPSGYKLLYQQSFDSEQSLKDFAFTDPAAWKQVEDDKLGETLDLVQQSKYSPEHRSPVNIAMIRGLQFTDFILEVNLLQTGRVYGHQDMCVFFGIQDPSHFYYSHIAVQTDDHAHNVFIVNEAPRAKISPKTTQGVVWGQNEWHKVRLERSVAAGTIKVYYDDMSEPIMLADDKTFGAGFIGFGSFDDVGKVDNIKIWGPAAIKKDAGFYSVK